MLVKTLNQELKFTPQLLANVLLLTVISPFGSHARECNSHRLQYPWHNLELCRVAFCSVMSFRSFIKHQELRNGFPCIVNLQHHPYRLVLLLCLHSMYHSVSHYIFYSSQSLIFCHPPLECKLYEETFFFSIFFFVVSKPLEQCLTLLCSKLMNQQMD